MPASAAKEQANSNARTPVAPSVSGVEGLVVPAPEVPLTRRDVLGLQRVVGNQAVNRMLASRTAERRETPRGLRPARPATIARAADRSRAIQRNGGGDGGGQTDQQGGDARPAAMAAIQDAPDVPEEAVPDGDRMAEAIAAGEQVGAEIGAAQGNPGVAAAVAEEVGATPDEAPPEPSPEPIAALNAYVGSLGGGGGGGEDDGGGVGGTEPEEAAAGGETSEPAPARPTNKSTRYGNNSKFAASTTTTVGKTGSSLSGTGIEIAKAAGGALTKAGATAAAALGYVAAGLGAIVAIFDIKSAVTSGMAMNRLEAVMAELKQANPQDVDLINDIQYAIDQKYSKARTRAVKAVTGLLGSGITIGALASGVALGAIVSNPVGWVIGAVIVGLCAVVGFGIIAYKLGHKFLKWWRGDLGIQRRAIALRLYDKNIAGDPTAAAAIQALGLDPEKMRLRAAAGESDEAREQREASKAGQKVAASLEKSKGEAASAADVAENARIEVEQIKTKIAWIEKNADKAQHFSSPDEAKKQLKPLQKQLKKAEKDYASKQKKAAEKDKKQGQDQVMADWKLHSKKAREDISFIERKLKK